MSTEQSEPARPLAPPTQPGALVVPTRASIWPKVIGILAVVLAVLGLAGAVWGLLSPFGPRDLPGLADSKVLEVAARWKPWTRVMSLVSFVLSLLLLAAGIGILGRRGWGRSVARAWAVLQIVSVGISSLYTYRIQQDMFLSVPQASPTPTTRFASGFAASAVCIGLVSGWAPPAFALIWFRRGKIQDEVAGWR